MDLYGDLPAAVGAAMALDANDKSKTSSVWAKGVTSFAAGSRNNAPSVNTRPSMLPASLASSRRAKSPDAGALAAAAATAKNPARGVSLAFRPASITRKQPAQTTTTTTTTQAASATEKADVAEQAPRGGLGFVAATTWTQLAVEKATITNSTSASATDPEAGTDTSMADAPVNAHFFQARFRDEYHPSRPNSYEAFCDERAAKQKREQVLRGLERRQREQDKEDKRERDQLVKDMSEGKALSIAMPLSAGRGKGMTMPAWMKKKIEEDATRAGPPQVETRSTPIEAQAGQFEDALPRGGLGFAGGFSRASNGDQTQQQQQRRESSSRDEFGREVVVGRARQNERDPLRPNYSSSHSPGHERDPEPGRTSAGQQRSSPARVDVGSDINAPKRPRTTTNNFSRAAPSEPRQGPVILLQNMVGPGEVDDDLQDEVKEECTTKYGPVDKCIVYELRGRVPPEEAVRIFVAFRNPTDATQALDGLHGRFFGGRRVHASFYDEAKFAQLDLNGQVVK